GLLDIACVQGLLHGVVRLAGRDPLPVRLLHPPLAATDQGQSQRQSPHQAEAVLLQPVADPLALFVLVEQFIQRHRLLPVGPVRGRWRDKRSDRERPASEPGARSIGWSRRYCPAGAMEPSEDTVKRATFARWKADRS